jgi:hypothetical protein
MNVEIALQPLGVHLGAVHDLDDVLVGDYLF